MGVKVTGKPAEVRDEAARPGSDIVTERPASVRSGLTWQELLDR